jgi:hypothetical protein
MQTPIQPLIEWANNQIANYMSQFGTITNKQNAFAAWILGYIHLLEDDDAFNQSDTLSQGDLGCDGYHYGEDDSFYLLQAKYSETPLHAKFNNTAIQEIVSAYTAMLEPSMLTDRNEKIQAIGSKLRDAINGGSQPVLQCAVFGHFTDEAKLEAKAIEVNLPHGARIDLIDLELLSKTHFGRETQDDLSGTTINFKIHSKTTISNQINPTSIIASLVCNLDARDLAKIVDNNRPRIFDQNVRSHLGHQNRVNTGIRHLLENDDTRPYFWYYNNGLTILCDSYIADEAEQTIKLSNPQIVNGCQTASALADKRSHFDSESKTFPVLARIISVSTDLDGQKTVLKISENTNSQSPVSSSDLKSNSYVQQQLQVAFEALNPPWFYERKRGEWQYTLTRARKTFFGNRKVTMVQIGQRWIAYAGKPAESITEKESIFTDPVRYGEAYNAQRHPNEYLLSHEIFDRLSNLLSRSENVRRGVVAGSSFDSRYLNRTLRAKSFWVAHMTNLTRHILHCEYGSLDLDKINRLLHKLRQDLTSFDNLNKLIILAFKNWSDSLDRDSDLRAEFKRSTTARDLENKLDDIITAWPQLSDDELPIPRN